MNYNFNKKELLILNNALNEILNGPDAIDEVEFDTRVGNSRENALVLLKKIGAILDKMQTEDLR